MSGPNPLLQLSSLSKVYREGGAEKSILDRVELSILPGEFVVLLGKSGSGKSTLLNLISGMDTPSSGDVRLMGQSLKSLSEAQLTQIRRQQIGIVFQSFNLIPTLTVEENVRLPLELNGRKNFEAVSDLLQQVGLLDRRRVYPDRLSGGEQQRVALARALVHAPALLLADEPTGNLDAHTGGEALNLLDSLVRQRGGTMLVATHDREMRARADRVVALVDGRLVPS